jgi:hypothetical protein
MSPNRLPHLRQAHIPDGSHNAALRSTRNRPRTAVRRGAAWPAEPRGTSWLPTDRRSSARFRPIRVGHAVDPATANHLPVSTAKSRPTPPLTPARPAPASSARLRLGQTTSRSWTRQATTPTPAIPAVRLPAPPPRSTTSLRSADAERTDTGRRTLDTWTLGRSDARTGHWTPVAWTGTRGHWTLAPDTGRRTLAEDADRVTTARPAPGLSWATTSSDRALDADPCC